MGATIRGSVADGRLCPSPVDFSDDDLLNAVVECRLFELPELLGACVDRRDVIPCKLARLTLETGRSTGEQYLRVVPIARIE